MDSTPHFRSQYEPSIRYVKSVTHSASLCCCRWSDALVYTVQKEILLKRHGRHCSTGHTAISCVWSATSSDRQLLACTPPVSLVQNRQSLNFAVRSYTRIAVSSALEHPPSFYAECTFSRCSFSVDSGAVCAELRVLSRGHKYKKYFIDNVPSGSARTR